MIDSVGEPTPYPRLNFSCVCAALWLQARARTWRRWTASATGSSSPRCRPTASSSPHPQVGHRCLERQAPLQPSPHPLAFLSVSPRLDGLQHVGGGQHGAPGHPGAAHDAHLPALPLLPPLALPRLVGALAPHARRRPHGRLDQLRRTSTWHTTHTRRKDRVMATCWMGTGT